MEEGIYPTKIYLSIERIIMYDYDRHHEGSQ